MGDISAKNKFTRPHSAYMASISWTQYFTGVEKILKPVHLELGDSRDLAEAFGRISKPRLRIGLSSTFNLLLAIRIKTGIAITSYKLLKGSSGGPLKI